MSAFAPLKLAGLTCAGVGGTCSVVYAGGSFISDISSVEADDDSVIKTIADDFSTRLISSTRSEAWKTRLSKLKGDKNKTLDKGLEAIRDSQEKKEADLKTWCEEARIKPKEGKDSELVVKGVEDYCTYTIKDQASKVMSKNRTKPEDWKLVDEAFLKNKKESFSKELQEVWDGVSEKAGTSGKLKDWCFKKYDEPFKGKDDPVFKEVSKVCAAVNPPKPPAAKPAVAKPAAPKPEANKQTDPVNTQPQDQATVPQSPSQPAVSSSPVTSTDPSGAKQAGDI
ncbi:hypothetical protein HF1_07640 [Mycoplasma haemofelis str. Langford 1]|uniref:Uncharacterized protein n=1 Tax=Mycoplasma haemofelis (strain Langford 1) TaxID=941640 RepID=E8ZI01_MYCHL|nr:hypothetical protein [Mycoplasma haemofelis]CBY92772.1 hypothetical protein HF1_07640 [Mycoplasma haemofelis str. Langford 1]